MNSDIRKAVKVALAKQGVTLADVARAMGRTYPHVLRVVHGYYKGEPGEVHEILRTIARLGQEPRP